MRTIVRLIFCLLLLVGWGLAALSLHVVRTGEQIPITLVPKEKLGIEDTYVDTRNWTADDVAAHPEVVRKLIDTQQADVLRHCIGDPKGDVSAQLSDVLAGAENESKKFADDVAAGKPCDRRDADNKPPGRQDIKEMTWF